MNLMNMTITYKNRCISKYFCQAIHVKAKSKMKLNTVFSILSWFVILFYLKHLTLSVRILEGKYYWNRSERNVIECFLIWEFGCFHTKENYWELPMSNKMSLLDFGGLLKNCFRPNDFRFNVWHSISYIRHRITLFFIVKLFLKNNENTAHFTFSNTQ